MSSPSRALADMQQIFLGLCSAVCNSHAKRAVLYFVTKLHNILLLKYGTNLMQRRTRTRVIVYHSHTPRTRARKILARNPLELLARVDHQVYSRVYSVESIKDHGSNLQQPSGKLLL